TASAESTTCHTITDAISIGLPSSSLTLSRPLSKLRTRIDTLRLAKNGLLQRRPLSLTVPTYLPNRLSTAAWLGSTLYRPIRQNTARATSTALAMTCIAAGSPPVAPTPWKNSQAAAAATTRTPSSIGMPGRERIGFSFMTGLLVSPIGQVIDIKLISSPQALPSSCGSGFSRELLNLLRLPPLRRQGRAGEGCLLDQRKPWAPL